MSRPIKFRAMHKVTKEWKAFVLPNDLFIAREDEMFDYEHYCQFTGLLDRNGREIYEGDLLSNGMGVVWSKYAFVPAYDWGRSDDFEDWGTDWNSKVEVIGNVYQNPELLK